MMNPVRRRRLTLILFSLTVLMVVTGLVMYALRQNISLFYTPSQLGQAKGIVRLGGMVVKNSIHRSSHDLTVEFQLTDFKETITVTYQGILPDLFREDQGIVALGQVIDSKHFKAQEVLAKHDANYMPAELKSALKTAATNHNEVS